MPKLQRKPRLKGSRGTVYYRYSKPKNLPEDSKLQKLFLHRAAYVRDDPKRGVDLFYVEADEGDWENMCVLEIDEVPKGCRKIAFETFAKAVG